MTVALANRWFTSRFFKAILLLVAVEGSLCVPLTGRLLAADTTDLAAEYEEWGLEPPVSAKEPKPEPEPIKPDPQAARANDDRPAEGPAVPADLAARFGQAAVLIVAVMEDGKELHTAGWIVDKERRVVMTNHPLIAVADKLFVAYPQIPGSEEGSLTGSPALLMQSNSHLNITYLQVESQLPAALPTLILAAPRAQPTNSGQAGFSRDQGSLGGNGQHMEAPRHNPLVGQWYLQDVVGDYHLTMLVRFDEQGKFRMDTAAVYLDGSEDREVLVGTYLIRGDTLLLQTNEGSQQAQFKFENGYLNVTMPDGVVTFTFERVEKSQW